MRTSWLSSRDGHLRLATSCYRATSLIRNRLLLGPYSRSMPYTVDLGGVVVSCERRTPVVHVFIALAAPAKTGDADLMHGLLRAQVCFLRVVVAAPG